METLPNGLVIFNATPHPIRFWGPTWPEPVEVEPDELVNAHPVEKPALRCEPDEAFPARFRLVTVTFESDEAGWEVIRRAYESGADLVVGSIIAARAYPGQVVAMVPAEGFERVAPAKKRMRPDKFTAFGDT